MGNMAHCRENETRVTNLDKDLNLDFPLPNRGQ